MGSVISRNKRSKQDGDDQSTNQPLEPSPSPVSDSSPSAPPLEVEPDTIVSNSAIEEIVEDFMKDSAINNMLLPDFIEKALYTNVLKLVMGLIGRTLDTTNIDFLGHTITLQLRPNDEV